MNDIFRIPAHFSANRVWFTADTHFGHENIILFTKRPFENVVDMDKTLTNLWNGRVKSTDYIFHLGDFCLGGAEFAQSYFKELSGYIHVLGLPWHHDRRWLGTEMFGRSSPVVILPSQVIVEIPQAEVTLHLNHYPMQSWDRSHYNVVHLYGHVHQYQNNTDEYKMNVGVDVCRFAPINLTEILNLMAAKGWPKSKI